MAAKLFCVDCGAYFVVHSPDAGDKADARAGHRLVCPNWLGAHPDLVEIDQQLNRFYG